jgi:hypothetical protein
MLNFFPKDQLQILVKKLTSTGAIVRYGNNNNVRKFSNKTEDLMSDPYPTASPKLDGKTARHTEQICISEKLEEKRQ